MRSHLSLTVVVAVSVWSTSSGLAQTQSPSQTSPQPKKGTSVAVIDINYIFENHARIKSAMEDIKNDIKAYEEHLREERSKITAKTEQLKRAPAGSSQYAALEEELARMQTQLGLATNRKGKETVERQGTVYFNAYREIEDAVGRFADRYGIDLVLRFRSESVDPSNPESVLQGINRGVVFHRSLDITQHILDSLNRQSSPLELTNDPRGTLNR